MMKSEVGKSRLFSCFYPIDHVGNEQYLILLKTGKNAGLNIQVKVLATVSGIQISQSTFLAFYLKMIC